MGKNVKIKKNVENSGKFDKLLRKNVRFKKGGKNRSI